MSRSHIWERFTWKLPFSRPWGDGGNVGVPGLAPLYQMGWSWRSLGTKVQVPIPGTLPALGEERGLGHNVTGHVRILEKAEVGGTALEHGNVFPPDGQRCAAAGRTAGGSLQSLPKQMWSPD